MSIVIQVTFNIYKIKPENTYFFVKINGDLFIPNLFQFKIFPDVTSMHKGSVDHFGSLWPQKLDHFGNLWRQK